MISRRLLLLIRSLSVSMCVDQLKKMSDFSHPERRHHHRSSRDEEYRSRREEDYGDRRQRDSVR